MSGVAFEPEKLTAEERHTIRGAMLHEQSEWLDEADRALTQGNYTMMSVARIIADTFERVAAKYKREESSSDVVSSDALPGVFGEGERG